MKVLFLDDMEERHTVFQELFKEEYEEIVHVYTFDQCRKALGEQKFDLVFLDHDLSMSSIMCDPFNSRELTGSDVALLIARTMDPEDAPGFIIHSLNPAGRKRMCDILTDAGFQATEKPFHLL